MAHINLERLISDYCENGDPSTEDASTTVGLLFKRSDNSCGHWRRLNQSKWIRLTI